MTLTFKGLTILGVEADDPLNPIHPVTTDVHGWVAVFTLTLMLRGGEVIESGSLHAQKPFYLPDIEFQTFSVLVSRKFNENHFRWKENLCVSAIVGLSVIAHAPPDVLGLSHFRPGNCWLTWPVSAVYWKRKFPAERWRDWKWFRSLRRERGRAKKSGETNPMTVSANRCHTQTVPRRDLNPRPITASDDKRLFEQLHYQAPQGQVDRTPDTCCKAVVCSSSDCNEHLILKSSSHNLSSHPVRKTRSREKENCWKLDVLN